jgi:hypothetical protein
VRGRRSKTRAPDLGIPRGISLRCPNCCAARHGIAPATAAHACGFRTEFAADSPLEEEGFEPPVPLGPSHLSRHGFVARRGGRSRSKKCPVLGVTDDANPGDVFVVHRHRRTARSELLALRHRAGLADVRDDGGIGDGAFRVAREAVAVGQVFNAVVANTERGLLKVDARSALHQRSLELVAADHLVQHLSWGMSRSGGARPAPRQPVPPPSTGSSPPMRPSSGG